MQTVDIIQFVEDHNEFLITYYAKKYGEIITRRGTWTKPNTDTKGNHFETKDGNDILNEDGTTKEFKLKAMRFKPLEYLCEGMSVDDVEEIKE